MKKKSHCGNNSKFKYQSRRKKQNRYKNDHSPSCLDTCILIKCGGLRPSLMDSNIPSYGNDTLENTEEAIKNKRSRETGNIWYTR
jgi:hypothetical protein